MRIPALAAALMLVVLVTGPAVAGAETLRRDVAKALKLRTASERATALDRAVGSDASADAGRAVLDLVLPRDEQQIVLDVAVRSVARVEDPAILEDLRRAAGSGPLLERVRAIEVLGKSRAPGAADVLVPLAADASPAVRAAALTALGATGDAARAVSIAPALSDDEWIVRSAAVASLARLEARDQVPLLCWAMRRETGRLVDDIAGALAAITGKRFGPDAAAYERWWASQEKDQEKRGDTAAGPWKAPDASFLSPHFESRSRRVLFILSTSDSMKDEVPAATSDHARKVLAAVGEDLAKDLDDAKTKLDVARVHLRSMIRSLADDVLFDVLVYSASPDFAFGELTRADASSRKRAEARVARISPGGQGNLHGALLRALDPKARDPLAVTDGPDTIVLFSDGTLDAPGSTDDTEVAGVVRRANAVRQVRFVTFAVGLSETELLDRLAAGPPAGLFLSLP